MFNATGVTVLMASTAVLYCVFRSAQSLRLQPRTVRQRPSLCLFSVLKGMIVQWLLFQVILILIPVIIIITTRRKRHLAKWAHSAHTRE